MWNYSSFLQWKRGINREVASLEEDNLVVFTLSACLKSGRQWLATGQWFSQCTPVSSTNKTDRHYIYLVESGIKHHNPNP